MKVSGVLTSDSVEGDITDFGHVSPAEPLTLTESQLRRIEAKRGVLIGDIPMPQGVVFTFVVEDEEKGE